MSTTIPVRVAGGQVLLVPPVRLAWASTRPRLIELMDTIGEMQQGLHSGGQTAQLAICAEFLAEVVKASDYQGPEVEADVADCVVIRMALRGCPPDPTKASAESSGT